ncbi:MAG: nucleotidyltransferase family protein, partial [Fimbriimonas sp.]
LTRDEALTILRREKPRLIERYGITALGLFGSTARDQAGPNSDVDVLVHLQRPTLSVLTHIHDDLENALGTRVDLIRFNDNLGPFLKDRIKEEGVYV